MPTASDPRAALVVARAELLSPQARELITALNTELLGRYPEEGANHLRLDEADVARGRGAFLIAWLDGSPVGCGAIRRVDDDTMAAAAEIKRMYVRPEQRGRGVGRAILQALESQAHALGVTRLVLETGDRQPEAIALYERCGFTRTSAFGEYVGSRLSVCMAKPLAAK